MTIDEAIKHCLEVAERNYELADKFDAWDEWEKADADNCRSCAADHRQLAEWLKDYKKLEAKHWDECRQIAHYDDELKEAKRLLKAAVEDMNNGGCNSNCYKCKHCGECDFSERFTWKHTDETEKLLGDSENEY